MEVKTEGLAEYARRMDEKDPLRHFRERFLFPQHNGRPVIYLTGNSLGLQPKSAGEYLKQELDDWATFGVEGHFKAKRPWYAYHEFFSESLAKLVGAKPTEVVAMNGLTVNLHLMLVSFYRPKGRRTKILCEQRPFPSDTYAMASQIRLHGLDPKDHLVEMQPRPGEHILRTEDIEEKIDALGEELALVHFGGVNFYTGQAFEMDRITESAHAVGAIAGFNLAHAAGNLIMHLHSWNVDFATWCGYKYLNSGPGAVAGAFVHEGHHREELPRLAGWWGHDKVERFKMEPEFEPMPTTEAWQLSNAPVFSMAVHRAALDIFDEAGMERLREKSVRLTNYLEAIIDGTAQETGARLEIITPRDAVERGCQLSVLAHDKGKALFEALTARGVVVDWREPNPGSEAGAGVMRMAPVPLYNSFEDVWRFGEICATASGHEGDLHSNAVIASRRRAQACPSDARDDDLVKMSNITIVGGGLVGSLLAVFLAKRGHKVGVYERRSDPRQAADYAGRSINLVVSHRGWTALRAAGVEEAVKEITVPVYARMTHDRDGKLNRIPYSIENKAIYSVSRGELNRRLLTEAEKLPNVTLHFEHRCMDVDLENAACTFKVGKDEVKTAKADVVFGADGVFSAVRQKMSFGRFNYSQEYIEHDYKEIAFPGNTDGSHRMDPHCLHIWPRRYFMLMGLANQDGGFTGTLFMPHTATEHAPGFDKVKEEKDVRAFFQEQFPDVPAMIPDVVEQYLRNPQSALVIVRCGPWNHKDKAALIGDAAHAIVPFYGEGMNAGYEDCKVLNDLLDQHGDDNWGKVLHEYAASRKPNGDAIAELSLRNFIEMRDLVADPKFILRKKIEGRLQQKHPDQWLPLYSQVKFSDIEYKDALREGQRHDRIMEQVLAMPGVEETWEGEEVERRAMELLDRAP